MGIPTFDVDVGIIAKLGDYPGADNGLTPQGFREKFDLAPKLIQEYINKVLIPNIDISVDADALVAAAQKKLEASFNVELAKYFEKVVQIEDCVLTSGYRFSANRLSDTLIQIYGGEAVVQGHVVTLNTEDPVNIAVSAGTYGTYRNDLICLRYSRTEDGTEATEIVYLQGTTSQTEAVDPAYLQNDINIMAAVSTDLPLYRIRVQNTTASLEALFTPVDGFLDLLANESSLWEGGEY